MTSPSRAVAALVFGILLTPCSAIRAEVIHGFHALESTYDAYYGNWSNDSFDFLTQAIVPFTSESADVYYGEEAHGGTYYMMGKNCTGGAVEGKLEDLTVAPELVGAFTLDAFWIDRTFVVRTGDNIYAKFAVRSIDSSGDIITIEYYVQTDGSPNFGPLVAVQSTTWGRVKALYR